MKTAATATAVGLIAGLTVAAPTSASAHGSIDSPASRVVSCKEANRNHPTCAGAWAANAQSLYDWMEVNIGNAAGNHRQLIPDEKLCSANRSKYAYFDRPAQEWPATALQPDSDGKYTVRWNSTAPHSTAYYRVYLTKPNFDPSKRLSWGDLELVHDTGKRRPERTTTMRMNLPERSGRHMLYTIWQRDDSPEAFYACSDVTFSGTPGVGVPAPGSPDGGGSSESDQTQGGDGNSPGGGSVSTAPGSPRVKVLKGLRVRLKWLDTAGAARYKLQVSKDGQSRWRTFAKTGDTKWRGRVKKARKAKHRFFRVVAVNPSGENLRSPAKRVRVKQRKQ